MAAGTALADEAPHTPMAPITLNQTGLESAGPKLAILADPATVPLDWRLVDAQGAVVAQGKTRVYGDDAASGRHVHQIDFSQVRQAGQGYRLTVGDRASRPFALTAAPDGRLLRASLSFFYQQRSGVPIEAALVERPDLARPAGHRPDRATCFNLADPKGQVWPGCDYTLDASGGWYDAGDQGKYVVNGGISVWTLVNAYERARLLNRTRALAQVADGTLAVPEHGNGVPDILDEARFELEFLLSMQVPDGKSLEVPIGDQRGNAGHYVLTRIDAGGLAHQKIADAHWTGLPTAPADDHVTRYLYYPTTGASLNLAAVAAQAARVWKDIDPAFAVRCLAAARRAFAAAQRHPYILAQVAFDGSGGYGDPHLADEVYWAAAELYATTGDAAYLATVRASPYFTGAEGTGDLSWGSVATAGALTLALSDRLGAAERNRVRAQLLALADRYLADEDKTGYRLPFAPTAYPWGSNGAILNRAMVLGVAHDLTGKAAYRTAVVDAIDYVLGRNPLDRSFVTGFGARPMEHPHHRFWARQVDARNPVPPSGVLSGGPNSSAMDDTVAKTLKGTCAPQTCWVDDLRAYTMNEVTINWNAPLAWVALWLDDTAD
ncbi:glycoside hydrolase family 9 protein [Nitrospirillum sp. BR 11164]|uniref:glycoside hydrolase family 9 protein n=1 Tax=Nitrospirillum sp. BR 11164 TaxID=3104324 RepID=UPI002AFE7429|nr:glycoside hydrolase family 9 protein [Nitrospirillum sp. BR 11164]MEA1648164.1 glycoside hydrolase family 9 protein [Nitrospirillum sp. BR 11164]